jgi:hypothetical protein
MIMAARAPNSTPPTIEMIRAKVPLPGRIQKIPKPTAPKTRNAPSIHRPISRSVSLVIR